MLPQSNMESSKNLFQEAPVVLKEAHGGFPKISVVFWESLEYGL